MQCSSAGLLNYYIWCTELLKLKTVVKEVLGKKVSFEAIAENSERYSQHAYNYVLILTLYDMRE